MLEELLAEANTRAEHFKAKYEQSEKDHEQTRRELAVSNVTIRKARNPEPIERPGFLRVLRLVHSCCMNLERIKGGWLLSMGSLKRRFRTLKEIWEILIQEEWSLLEVLPPNKHPLQLRFLRLNDEQHPRKIRPRRPDMYPSLAPPASAFFSKNLAPPDAWGWT